jgi:outer membrane protein assembly factor BamB
METPITCVLIAKGGNMKRILTKVAFASRSLRVIATVAILCAVPLATALKSADDNQAGDLFYTTSSAGTDGAVVVAIQVRGSNINIREVGPTNGGACISLALSPSGTLYSMCGQLFGTQKLATIDLKTGLATLFGEEVTGLAVMAMASDPKNGTLYAVGNVNSSDPNFNSLYTVDEATGAFTRVGSTGAPQFFMDLAFDRNGNMFGVTTSFPLSPIPAILYRIDPATGKATKIVNLVGSNFVMGIAFGGNGKLYATDFEQNPGLYLIDINTGFETAIAALPSGLGFSSALELVNSHED